MANWKAYYSTSQLYCHAAKASCMPTRCQSLHMLNWNFIQLLPGNRDDQNILIAVPGVLQATCRPRCGFLPPFLSTLLRWLVTLTDPAHWHSRKSTVWQTGAFQWLMQHRVNCCPVRSARSLIESASYPTDYNENCDREESEG